MSNKHPLADCDGCPLQKKDCAPTSGPADAKIAIVSRSPGRYDAERKRSFAGPSGVVLDHLLSLYNTDRKDVLVTNLVLCETDNPPRDAIRRCSKRLFSEIASADTVIAAGAEAAMYLAKTSVTRGRSITHERWASQDGQLPKQQRVIVTTNPVMVIRNSDTFPSMVEDFKLALDPPPPTKFPEIKYYNRVTTVRQLLKQLALRPLVACDLEGHRPHIECIGFSTDGTDAHVITRKGVEESEPEIRAYFEKTTTGQVWHNGIYDVKLLKDNGVSARISEDTFALSYVLDERPGYHSLAYLARLYLGWPNYEPAAVEKYKETGELIDPQQLYEYNGMDVAATFQLFSQLFPKAAEDGQMRLYTEQLIPLFNALSDIERRGFRYDIHRAADLNEEVVLPKLRELKAELAKLAELELYNPRSAPQTKAIVYDRWGLKHFLRDTGRKKRSTSFDKDVRREVRDGRFKATPRFRDRLIEFATVYDTFSSIDKQRGTFIEGLIKRVGADGRLYCEFNPCGTVTGRTSSRNPNFQNITRSGRDVVPGIRTLFLPSKGNRIIQADYSQAELRCIAKFSGDKELLAIYRDGTRSLHKETCEKFYGKNYTKDQYTYAKNINFGVCYGQGAKAFSQMYTMPVEEAQSYIDNWFRMFPLVEVWRDSVRKLVASSQVVVNPIGRKRRFHLITEENEEECYREGINFLPQSTTNEFTENAVSILNNDYNVPIISTVHDSIIADVAEDDVAEVAELIKQVMESRPSDMFGWNDILFKVDISVGSTWGDVE